MTNVIAFPKRPDARPPSMATPMPAQRWADVFFDRDQWRLSKKGNSYVRLDEYCVTLFHRPTGWAWCIAATGAISAVVVGRDLRHRARGPRRRMGMAGRTG